MKHSNINNIILQSDVADQFLLKALIDGMCSRACQMSMHFFPWF